MYPTLFTIPFLPAGLGEVKSYGFMLMIGFLASIYLAARRAIRVQANPDIVLNIGLISLVAGVAGARIMYVWHYWDDRFATADSPFWEAVRIDRGGLEFIGGPIAVIPCVMIYLWRAKASLRWYMDIVAPSLMFGLTFGRVGCLLNGCCWGGVCTAPHTHQEVPQQAEAGIPGTLRFPYGSPAMLQQYEFRQLTLPKELIWMSPTGQSMPLPRDLVFLSDAEVEAIDTGYTQSRQTLEKARSEGADEARLATLKEAYDTARYRYSLIEPLRYAHRHYDLNQADMQSMAANYRSLPVYPTQIYSGINAIFLSWVLSLVFYRRQRHGVVFGLMLLIYPVTRFLLELIRQDNPLDFGGLTISQQAGIGMFVFGVLYFAVIMRMPMKSAWVQKFVFEDDEDSAAPAAVARPAK